MIDVRNKENSLISEYNKTQKVIALFIYLRSD